VWYKEWIGIAGIPILWVGNQLKKEEKPKIITFITSTNPTVIAYSIAK